MDIRYANYISPNSSYYRKVDNDRNIEMFRVNLPLNWKCHQDRHWTYCMNNLQSLPVQGWKIHISCVLCEAEDILKEVSEYLFNMGTSFKFVKNSKELLLKNSKYGDRGSSGKFITVYPRDQEQFLGLLDSLDNLTKHYSKGPYILSDRRWKNGNVFFRYGGFKEMYSVINGNRVLSLKTPDGGFIPDERNPFYTLPYFVIEPPVLSEKQEEYSDSKLDEFEISEALHFSNGGGVYKAISSIDGSQLVIKEGRPEAGIDAMGRDAYTRVEHEGKILEQLKQCSNVVGYREIFKEWEHIFLVEEYVEGMSLQQWVASNYPFESNDQEEYAMKAMKLLENLKHAIEEIHSCGVGIGDLQPANIIIQKNLSIKLIDFEVADNIECEQPTGLMTIGFYSAKAKNRKSADYFALSRIAQYLFLPIGNVQEIDEGILEKHLEWIQKKFGTECFKTVEEIYTMAAKLLPINMQKKTENSIDICLDNIRMIISNLRQGMIAELGDSDKLINGDIRQYEMKDGVFNVLTGSYGAILSLMRTGDVPLEVRAWSEKYARTEKIRKLGSGLFTGKAGIAGILIELGDQEIALELLDEINIDKETNDISLLSGLAGIGLSFLATDKYLSINRYQEKVEIIANILHEKLQENIIPEIIDIDFVNVGLLDGWTGVSMFFSALYRSTRKDKWLIDAIVALSKDIEQGTFTEELSFQVKDGFRVLPYLAGGSAGIGLGILEIQDILKNSIWHQEVEGIAKVLNSVCYYNDGLFRGIAGLFLLATALYEKTDIEVNLEKIFEIFNLFLITNEKGYFRCPGDYGLRLSDDVFSGTSGILLSMSSYIKGKWLEWLPIPINSNSNFLIGIKGEKDE